MIERYKTGLKVNRAKRSAKLIEIFSSIQGEGPYAGIRQIFIRFAGCNLNCVFCDTGKKDARETELDSVLQSVEKLEKDFGPHHSVSITGGEPLCQVEFLRELFGELRRLDYKIYLETNGTLARELKSIIKLVDIVSMDIKLPSSSGQRDFWSKHAAFLKIAKSKEVFIKAVITSKTKDEDIEKACDIVRRSGKGLIFVLQPESVTKRGSIDISGKRLDALSKIAIKRLKDVRVIPQTHKILGVR